MCTHLGSTTLWIHDPLLQQFHPKTRVFSNRVCCGALLKHFDPPTTHSLARFLLRACQTHPLSRGFLPDIFCPAWPSQKKFAFYEKSQCLGWGGVPTTFPNSAKPSLTFKNDACQGQLCEKVGGYTWTSSPKVIQISSSCPP